MTNETIQARQNHTWASLDNANYIYVAIESRHTYKQRKYRMSWLIFENDDATEEVWIWYHRNSAREDPLGSTNR